MSARNWLDRYASFPIGFALVAATPLASARLFALLFYRYVHSAPLWRVVLLEGVWIIATLGASLVISVLPMALFMNNREDIREHRTGLGLCPECGYDLCASKDRCSECGTAISPDRAPTEDPNISN
jgi:hypothetical protein